MATIPLGNGGNAVANPGQMLRAPAPSRVGEAISGLGNAIAGEGIRELQQQTDLREQRTRAQANTAMARTENELHDASDAISKQVLAGTLPADQAQAEFGKASQKITSTNLDGWDGVSQEVMQGHFTRVNGTLGRGIENVVEKRKQNETLSTISEFAEEQSRIAMREGPGVASARYDKMLDASGAAAGLAPAQVSGMKQAFKEKVNLTFLDAAATGALEKEDLGSLKQLREGLDGNDTLDPEKKSAMKRTIMSYERQVEANIQSRAAESKFDVISRSKDVQSMVLSGTPVPEGMAPTLDEYRRLYKQNGDAMWKREVGNYVAVSDVLMQMKSADPQQRAAMVASTKPQPGEGFSDQAEIHRAAAQAQQLIEKQLYTDPASYALKNSPRVQRAYKVMMDAPPEDKVAAMDFYARTTTAEQLRLGITTVRDETAGNKARQPRILTNEQANGIADQFNDQTGGGAKAALLVQGLEQTYGKYWPSVYSQLAGDNKLPPAALVIPNMQDPGARARLAQASVTKPEVFKEQMSSTDPKDISDSLLGRFGDARATFSAQGMDGMRTLSTVMAETEKLAMSYRAQGKSIGDSTRQAFTEVMGWKYDFQGSYRVPKSEQSTAVSSGARNALDGITADSIAPLTAAGATPEQNAALTLDAIKTNGQWITNGDESGLRLMVQGKDGAFYPVRKTDGSMFDMSWADLRSMAVISATPEGAQRRKDRGVQR